MAFPTTGILDTFTGADENPIATNWSGNIYGTNSDMQRLSNQMKSDGESFSGSYYDLSTFGPDCEVYCTVVTKPADGKYVVLGLRKTGLPTTYEGYELLWSNDAGGTDVYKVTRLATSSSRTDLIAFTGREYAAGDGLGLSMVGDLLTVWHRESGVWTEVDSVTDGTITGAGYLTAGIEQSDTTGVLDDFGGGTVVTAPTEDVYKRLYGPAQLTGSAADLYTCPASTKTRVLHVHASNPSASPVDVNLSIGNDTAATRVWDDLAVAADRAKDDYTDYTLAAGEKIQGWADSAATVTLTISGIEVPA